MTWKFLLITLMAQVYRWSKQSQSVSAGVIKNGRRGLLTDMPRNDDGSVKTRADVINGFRPMIKEYSAAVNC